MGPVRQSCCFRGTISTPTMDRRYEKGDVVVGDQSKIKVTDLEVVFVTVRELMDALERRSCGATDANGLRPPTRSTPRKVNQTALCRHGSPKRWFTNRAEIQIPNSFLTGLFLLFLVYNISIFSCREVSAVPGSSVPSSKVRSQLSCDRTWSTCPKTRRILSLRWALSPSRS